MLKRKTPTSTNLVDQIAGIAQRRGSANVQDHVQVLAAWREALRKLLALNAVSFKLTDILSHILIDNW
jgi:hypothetical protein